jgi:hypothetical protein
MACAANSSVGDFLRSLSREELAEINAAELFKLVEFVVLREEQLVSQNATVVKIRDAVNEWCCGSIHHWDVLEVSPWFQGDADDKADEVRRFVGQLRQKVSARRLADRRVQDELAAITEDVLAELFEEA